MKVRKGFTLIELLIVLAIIGVLMSIGIPVYTNQLQKAKARVIASNLRTIAQTAANLAILGENIDGFAGSITKYVKGLKDAGKYNFYAASDTDTGTWDIYVAYNDTDVPTTMIQEEIGDSCDASAVNSSGNSIGTASPACVLKDIPNVGF